MKHKEVTDIWAELGLQEMPDPSLEGTGPLHGPVVVAPYRLGDWDYLL